MPKKSIALVLLITLTLGPVSGVFGSVMDKINSYSIIQNFSRALWFESSDPNVSDYAIKVADSTPAVNSYGDYSITTFGKIGPDNNNVTFKDDQGNVTEYIDLVGSPPEYYFTDMVFIQQKYEEALVDLYFFRAESAWTQFDNNKRPAVDEAIAGTYWVAQQNGVSYTEEQIQAKFLEQLDAQLDVAVAKYHRYWKNQGLTNIDTLTGEYVEAIRSYYLDPNLETFETILSLAFHIEDEVGEEYFNWWTLTGIVSDLSSGLGTSLIMHGNENKNKFSLAPRVISPVEVSQAERELMFRG